MSILQRLRVTSTILTRFLLVSTLFLFLLQISKPAAAQTKGYRIGPRDVVTLTIYAGGKMQHAADLTVTSQGIVNVPFIGPVEAEGLTIPELEALITKPLAKDFFVSPEVNLRIKEYHSLQYYISGAVNSPGLYEMTSETTLLELVAKAGGVSAERGNVAYILRASLNHIAATADVEELLPHKEPVKVDLRQLLHKGDMSHNLVLQPGDVVYIPPRRALNLAESKIYIEGEVQRPGVYDYQDGLTALNACIMAGGFRKFAAPNRTKIIRQDGEKQEVIKINLTRVQKGKTPDVELRPGDRIHVPETWL